MKTLFLFWQDTVSWFPIGKLTYDNQIYSFSYVQGALQAANFKPLMAFPDLHETYTSIELFWPFANRLLNKSRPEYQEYIEWLNLDPNGSTDPITILGLSGGKRMTDSFEVFPLPERNLSGGKRMTDSFEVFPLPERNNAGEYQIRFFTNGLRHYYPRAAECFVGEELMLDDHNALMLRTVDRHIVGFCPRYLAGDFIDKQPEVVVEKVNPAPVPLQFRLMCKLTVKWTQSFQPFSGEEYKLMVNI